MDAPMGFKTSEVITTLVTLAAALGKRCDSARRHAICSGTTAKTTAYYTSSLVQTIGRSILSWFKDDNAWRSSSRSAVDDESRNVAPRAELRDDARKCEE
eukprot:8718596-Heterocapsa_arctica.AAC.1